MKLLTVVVATVLSLTTIQAEVTYIDHDKVQPFPEPKPTTISEKAAVKFKPQLEVTNGCFPYSTVQADGSVSAGLKDSGRDDEGCEASMLGSQVYSRSMWYNDKWATTYAWYLPRGGRRHVWETAIIWIDNPALEMPEVLGATLNSGSETKKQAPVEERYFSSTSVHLEQYHPFLVPTSSRLRFVENLGDLQNLITWEQLTQEARGGLTMADFGEGQMPLSDENFGDRLEDAWPF